MLHPLRTAMLHQGLPLRSRSSLLLIGLTGAAGLVLLTWIFAAGIFATVEVSASPSPVSNPAGYTVKLADFGAACNGSRNDQPALQQAINNVTAKGGGTVLVPGGNCRILQTSSSIFTSINGTVAIRGESANSQLSLDSETAGAYRELFRIGGGNNITFENLQLVRVSNVYGIIININSSTTNLTIHNVVMDGRKDSIGGQDIHGIAIFGQPGQLIKNSKVTNTTIKNMNFGLFQDSGVKSVTDGFSVDASTFTGNYADDLEFNAPSSTMTNINVTNSTFANNRASNDTALAGFGVGLANVQHGLIQNNTFSGYRYDPIHIEDRSADVTVDNNRISNAFTVGLNYASHVFIINASHDIRVTNNVFDTAANSNHIDCVYASLGGGAAVPYNISITGNTFKRRPNASAIGNYGAENLTQSGNITISLP